MFKSRQGLLLMIDGGGATSRYLSPLLRPLVITRSLFCNAWRIACLGSILFLGMASSAAAETPPHTRAGEVTAHNPKAATEPSGAPEKSTLTGNPGGQSCTKYNSCETCVNSVGSGKLRKGYACLWDSGTSSCHSQKSERVTPNWLSDEKSCDPKRRENELYEYYWIEAGMAAKPTGPAEEDNLFAQCTRMPFVKSQEGWVSPNGCVARWSKIKCPGRNLSKSEGESKSLSKSLQQDKWDLTKWWTRNPQSPRSGKLLERDRWYPAQAGMTLAVVFEWTLIDFIQKHRGYKALVIRGGANCQTLTTELYEKLTGKTISRRNLGGGDKVMGNGPGSNLQTGYNQNVCTTMNSINEEEKKHQTIRDNWSQIDEESEFGKKYKNKDFFPWKKAFSFWQCDPLSEKSIAGVREVCCGIHCGLVLRVKQPGIK